jgi:hypothetical protein
MFMDCTDRISLEAGPLGSWRMAKRVTRLNSHFHGLSSSLAFRRQATEEGSG